MTHPIMQVLHIYHAYYMPHRYAPDYARHLAESHRDLRDNGALCVNDLVCISAPFVKVQPLHTFSEYGRDKHSLSLIVLC